jgi:Pyruvate/2-oxoacid:ferredoxin oxidoreductase delta subunit
MTQFVELTVGIAAVVGFVVLIALALAIREFLRERRERKRMKRLEAAGMHIPASLHPVIDTDRCISSAACVAACPEGDVLGLIGGAGRLIHGAACVGHGQCAAECPVQAIRLVFGTSERGVDIPVVTSTFESNRAGVYIAGELGGMGLVRNAIRQGVAAGRDAAAKLDRKRKSKDQLDVVVVGAGPAGIGAGLACIEAGVNYQVIEQGTVGGTVAHFPRHKVVLTEPVEVPLFGRIHRAEMSKEELLADRKSVV